MGNRQERAGRRLAALILAGGILLFGCSAADGGSGDGGAGQESDSSPVVRVENGEVYLAKTAGGNPIAGSSDSGDFTYGGDPSVMVDGVRFISIRATTCRPIPRWGEKFITFRNMYVIPVRI